ncbi:MAG: formylglycine-generating enzyme family protein [Verrucomicrobiales bacterium]
MKPLAILFFALNLAAPAAPEAPEGMVFIPGGTYQRGNEVKLPGRAQYPEEGPVHEVEISPFFIDTHEVTNAQFAAFVKDTGYETQAERGWSRKDFPQAPPEALEPGALVFTPPKEEVGLWQPGSEWQWWQFTKGANWRHPQGPGSDIKDKMDHPVVCVTYEDARAYAKWAGKRLPTEAEWERAARGGKEQELYLWGKEMKPGDQWLANVFTGTFPSDDTAEDGFAGTAPVKSFPANPYGLHDMAGNVWEICSDLFRPDTYARFLKNPEKDPQGPKPGLAINQPMLQFHQQNGTWPGPTYPKPHPLSVLHVTRGGSHLCHTTYCQRYRPAARHYAESLAPANHTGFRCAKSLD